MSAINSLKQLILKCINLAPYKVGFVIFMMFLSSITAGVGIVLIIPLLISIGIEIDGYSISSPISSLVNDASDFLSISPSLGSILVVYLVLMIIIAAINFTTSVLTSSLRQSILVNLRHDLSISLFSSQWKYLNRAHMSDFMRLLTGQVQSVANSVILILNLSKSIVLVVVYLGFSMLLSPSLTSVALLLGLVLAVILWPINKLVHASGKTSLSANQDMHRSIFESVANLKIIKAFTAEESYLERMHSSNKLLEKQQLRITKFNALTRFVNVVGAAIAFTVLFYTAIQWLKLPVSNLIVLLFIFSRLMPQISSIQSLSQNIIHLAPSYEDLLEHQSTLSSWAEPKNEHSSPIPLNKELILQDVCYRYDTRQNNVVNDINTTIPCGSTTAILGPSGVGKSTLLDIISGLVNPSQGKLIIDGLEINATNQRAWRSSVAYVTQDVFLFHSTIRDNLMWVCPPQQFKSDSEADEAIWQALSIVSAESFIKALPEQLDTIIGDRGVKLSGGERQRLALARALLSKPSLLILDEATNALDLDNEQLITDALQDMDDKLTILIVAHNKTAIKNITNKLVLTPDNHS